MRFIRTGRYLKDLKRLGVTEAETAAIEGAISAQPAAGDVVVGLDGARKVRFAMRGRGKSGGGRAIYFLMLGDDTAALLMAYAKNRKSDLSPLDRKVLRAVVKELSDD